MPRKIGIAQNLEEREEVIKEILDIYAGDVPHDYTHYTDSDDSKSDSDDNQV